MKEKVTVGLIGMGGYGVHYVNAILNQSEEFGMECVGMVSTHPERYQNDEAYAAIPIYRSIEELYEHAVPQLLFIATPIHLHCRQVCYALEHGSNVLCEKPTSATLEDAKKMLELSKKTGKFVAIGYQRCFHPAVLQAKADVLAGKYGRPVRFKMLVVQRRPITYFARGWAGKIKAGEDYVYDSVANNSCAHFLHHLFFMAGEQLNTSAFPETIEAECYRVNEIENFDTITAKITTANGVELYFGATQSGETNFGPFCCCEFENGKIFIDEDGSVRGEINGEEEIIYGNTKEHNFRKIPLAVDAVRGEDTVFCDINTALPHSMTIQYIQDHVQIQDIQDRAEIINAVGDDVPPIWVKCVKGLRDAMIACYEEGTMLSTKL